MLNIIRSYFKWMHIITMLVLLGWLFGSVPVVHAVSCDVTGTIATDTTWGPSSCDSYIVTGSITVPTGVTLTIQPGTQVRFTADKSLTVNGKLVAIGTPQYGWNFVHIEHWQRGG